MQILKLNFCFFLNLFVAYSILKNLFFYFKILFASIYIKMKIKGVQREIGENSWEFFFNVKNVNLPSNKLLY